MILALKNGKLIPPRDVVAGRKRAFMLAAECVRIQAQLDGPLPDTVTRGGRDYKEWRASAERALTLHNLELRLLSEWLEGEGGRLMKKVAFMLGELIKDEVEFDQSELNLIEEFVTYVCVREVR